MTPNWIIIKWIRKYLKHRAIDVTQIALLLKNFESNIRRVWFIHRTVCVCGNRCVYIINDEDSMKRNYHIQQSMWCLYICMNRVCSGDYYWKFISHVMQHKSQSNLLKYTNNRNNNNHLTCYSHDFEQYSLFFSIFFLIWFIHSKQIPLDMALMCWINSGHCRCNK